MQFVMNEREADLLRNHLEEVALDSVSGNIDDAEANEEYDYLDNLQDEYSRIEAMVDDLSNTEFTLALDETDKGILIDWIEFWIEAAEDGFDNGDIEDDMIEDFNEEMNLMTSMLKRLEALS